MAAHAWAHRRTASPAPTRRERARPRTRVRRASIALPTIFAVLAIMVGTASVHGQATGGDIFNVNPGGAAPQASPPRGDYYGRDTECGGTDRRYYDNIYHTKGVVIPLSQLGEIEREQWTFEFHCGACGQDKAICWKVPKGPPPVPPNQPTALPSPGPMRNPQQPATDCAGLLAQARATAAAIEGGSTSPLVMQGLIRVLQQCPPAFPRPIQCFDMMVDAQSKVRTNPDYAERRAQEALLCYEKQNRGTPNSRGEARRSPPTFHYFYINGIHTPMNNQMVTAKGILPVRLKGIPGGYYTYEHELVNRNLVHWPGLRIENEIDQMEGYTHNFSQMDPFWTSLGAKFCDIDQQNVGAPAQIVVRQNIHDAIAAVLCPLLMHLDATRNTSIDDLVECFLQAIKPENFQPLRPPEILFTTTDTVVLDVTQQILGIYREELTLDPKFRSTNYFIVIGHSQGNFFTEAVGYQLANLSGPAGDYVFKNRLAVLSLGSPTSYDSLNGNPDFYQNKIAHITRKDDAIQIVDVASGFGVLGKRPWPRAQDTSALDKRRAQFELDFYFGSVSGALRANSIITAPQAGDGPNPLIVPFLNAHLLDNYLTEPTSTQGGTPVLKEVQRALRRLKRALLTGSQLTGAQ